MARHGEVGAHRCCVHAPQGVRTIPFGTKRTSVLFRTVLFCPFRSEHFCFVFYAEYVKVRLPARALSIDSAAMAIFYGLLLIFFQRVHAMGIGYYKNLKFRVAY